MKRGRGINTSGKRHGRLVRAVAVFFVLFTIADITLPQYFCAGEEIGGLPLASAAASDMTGPGADGGTEMPSPSRDSEQVPHEEDCFCCCAHVLAGLAFTAPASSELSTTPSDLGPDSLPSPPLPHQYHPPRFV